MTSAGWQQVSIPLADLVRSAEQPAGAPNDGLSLNEVWGYSFNLPYPAAGAYQFDLIRRTPFPPPTELVVTNLDDSGPGSLREALTLIADGGTITFDAGLAGGTLNLTSGQLLINRSVTVDASAAAPLTISAGGASRVLQVSANSVVAMNDFVLRDGAAAPQGGGILNYGTPEPRPRRGDKQHPERGRTGVLRSRRRRHLQRRRRDAEPHRQHRE